MAKERVVYAQRTSVPELYDTGLIADFAARGWTVTVVTDVLPSVPSYYDDVALLVIGSPGGGGTPHPSTAVLAGLPVPILTLCGPTANALGIGTAGYWLDITSFVRKGVEYPDPRSLFDSVALPWAYVQILGPSYRGETFHYGTTYSSYAGIARNVRTNGQEVVYWGYHPIDQLGGDALSLWHAWSGGFCLTPRSVKASIAGPAGLVRSLVSTPASGSASMRGPLGMLSGRILLGSAARLTMVGPLGSVGGLAVLTPSTYLRLPSPLASRVRALAMAAHGCSVRLASPLGRIGSLAGMAGGMYLTLPSPLGRVGAKIGQQTAVAPTPVPVGRPRLLSDPLPLRSSTELPEYHVDAPLAWVYGTVTLAPMPWNEAGTEWLLADHPIAGVHWVKVDGAETGGWELAQVLDALDHPVALLRLTQATATAPTVSLSGRQHPTLGYLLEHPADIAEDLLRQCGWTPNPGAFAPLQDARPDLVLGGVLDRDMTLREALAGIVASVGADWCAAPLRSWVGESGPALATLTPAVIDDGSATCDDQSLATVLRVACAYDWAAKAPRESFTIEAPEAIERYGRIEADLDLPWVRTARDALSIGSAYLADRARPRWKLALKVAAGSGWLPGDRLALEHPWLPRGAATLSAVSQDATGLGLTLERGAGPSMMVEVVGSGMLIDPKAKAAAGLQVSYSSGVGTFAILNETGAPMIGAAVTLDGMVTRTTDQLGKVQFTTTRGVHSLLIVASGYASMEIDVVV